jgi:hypothetical protein
MSEDKKAQEESSLDFVVDPLSDEELEDVSGGMADGGCTEGGGCSSGGGCTSGGGCSDGSGLEAPV